MKATRIIAALVTEQRRLNNELSAIKAALSALHGRPTHRVLSAEARQRIAAAQRKRWAVHRKKNVVSIKKAA